MASSQLPLSNVVTISVSEANAGIGSYNTSNLAIFSDETPADSFGDLGYALYLDPTAVGIDFGTSSRTFAMANSVFSQQPNILAGGGYLAVILLTTAQQTLTLSGVPASGTFLFTAGGNSSAAINWNDTASMIQTKIQAMPGFSNALVSGSLAGESLLVKFEGVYGALAAATVSSNSLETSGSTAITFTIVQTVMGETWGAAVTRTKNLVQYFGCMVNENLSIIGQTDLLAAAAVIQPLNKIGFAVSNQSADIQPGGMLDMLRTESLTQTRGLYYGDALEADDLAMMSAYAGRALSTNFSGSNTTSTMHLKQLVGVNPDPTMTETILMAALTAGADTYVSLQGVPAVFTSGGNQYFDQVYNLQWFVGALQVAGFNYLAGSSTKIPQTEQGMSGLKGAYRQVCQQAVANQYLAPGAWNSSSSFGNQVDFLSNIANTGYYIYSTPVAQQSQADRVARQAPLCQIAVKAAGAIQSSAVQVIVNQ